MKRIENEVYDNEVYDNEVKRFVSQGLTKEALANWLLWDVQPKNRFELSELLYRLREARMPTARIGDLAILERLNALEK